MPKRKSSRALVTSSSRPLPDTTLAPHTADTRKLVGARLPKAVLTRTFARWLRHKKGPAYYAPDLTDPDDEDETVSAEEAAAEYEELERKKTARAKDVTHRALNREWRDGFTVRGVKELEFEALLANPTSQTWTCFKLCPLSKADASAAATTTAPPRPRFHPSTFTASIAASLKPFKTPHFFAAPHPTLPITLLRVSLHEPHKPHEKPATAFWLAFPAGADHVFTTLSARAEVADVVTAAVAAALERERCRFVLQRARMIVKTLEGMCELRGAEGGSGGMMGGWRVYVDGFEDSPLATPRLTSEEAEGEGEEQEDGERAKKRRKKMVEGVFGRIVEGAKQEKIWFEVNDKWGPGGWRPRVGIKLEGTHVFKGLRELAEREDGGVCVEKLPAWMTGSEGVSSGVVKDGKVKVQQGSGRFSNPMLGPRKDQ